MRWLFASGGQNIGVSALAPVLPVNIQDWFPLGLTGLISLLSKGSQESYPAPQFKRIDSLALSLLYVPTLISVCDYRKTIALTLWTFVGKVMSLLFNMLSRFLLHCLHVELRVQLQVLANTVLLITNPMLLITLLGYQAEPNAFVDFLLAYS